jgi:hypothetical protein
MQESGGKGLCASIQEDLPVASIFRDLLFGQGGGGDIEVDAGGDLGRSAALDSLAKGAGGGSDIRGARIGTGY